MIFSSHRPPRILIPGNPNQQIDRSPMRVDHYSYVYRLQIERKLKYYALLYPHIDYMRWFHEVWERWTPENREEIEAQYSIHPSVVGAKSEIFTDKHLIKWQR